MSAIKIVLTLIALCTIGLLFGVDRLWIERIAYEDGFEQSDIGVHLYDLLDLGVVDINNDDHLDIFTVNHSAQQSLLENDGQGNYNDVFSSRGLEQSPGFPGLEDSQSKPPMERPGLYIFRLNRWLHIQAHKTAAIGVINGSLEFGWPVVVRRSGDRLEITEKAMESGAMVSHVSFGLADGEKLILNGADDIVEIPHHIAISETVPVSSIFVGVHGVNPVSHKFEMIWRDRHAMAWVDLNGDSAIDVYIARGGLKGSITQYPGAIADELFFSESQVYRDLIEATGIKKEHCPSRQVAWVDFDNDGDLDLYVSCGRDVEPVFPNQLFRQKNDGSFEDVATLYGLDSPAESLFVWFDSDNDGDMDLLSLDGHDLNHYVHRAGQLKNRTILEGVPKFRSLTVSDFDNDGYLDVYVSDRSKSELLINKLGRFSIVTPSTIGLPDQSVTAVWVDYDNDGLTDLYSVPGGLFKQSVDHTFHETGVLKYRASVSRIADARATWFDANSDGERDLVVAARFIPNILERAFAKALRALRNTAGSAGNGPSVTWSVGFFLNKSPPEHRWIQVKLIGAVENKQAIGARVYVVTPLGTQMRQIGASEGSRFSQGHYRLYFGLGDYATVDEMRIVWPDGHQQEMSNVPGNQLYKVYYDSNRVMEE